MMGAKIGVGELKPQSCTPKTTSMGALTQRMDRWLNGFAGHGNTREGNSSVVSHSEHDGSRGVKRAWQLCPGARQVGSQAATSTQAGVLLGKDDVAVACSLLQTGD
jgi:hypothetical protein